MLYFFNLDLFFFTNFGTADHSYFHWSLSHISTGKVKFSVPFRMQWESLIESGGPFLKARHQKRRSINAGKVKFSIPLKMQWHMVFSCGEGENLI